MEENMSIFGNIKTKSIKNVFNMKSNTKETVVPAKKV